MPWKEIRTVDQRQQFLLSYQKEEMSLTDLCHEYGISRPTAYKWIKRYDEVGPEGLLDLTRKPHGCSHATPAEIENEVLALRKQFPSWGARKLKARLERMNPNVLWPAASTMGQILNRAGLTNPKRKKRRTTPYSQPFSMVTAPNQFWCMDFKGYFMTGGIVHERIQPGKPQQNGRHERMHRTLKGRHNEAASTDIDGTAEEVR